jgi:gluconokinase
MNARVVIVMGVSGSGKTTVGKRLARSLHFPFCDADELHSKKNIGKMRRGEPLGDDDRRAWLGRVRARIDGGRDAGLVIACSALKRAYRRTLGIPDPSIAVVYLRVTPDVAARRLRERKGHFMPASLVPSQFEALEEPRGAIAVDADQPVAATVACALRELARL